MSKTIRSRDLTQVEPDFNDESYRSLRASRTREKVSLQIDSQLLMPLLGVLAAAAFLHFILGIWALTSVWTGLAVVLGLEVLVTKPKYASKALRRMLKIR